MAARFGDGQVPALTISIETLNALAVEAFNDLLKKHGKRQLVKTHSSTVHLGGDNPRRQGWFL